MAKNTTRVALNVKFLAIRLIGLSVRVVPFKSFWLNSIGTVIGLLFMFQRIRQWGMIIRFARHTGSPLPDLIYLMKYFIQQGKDGVWGYVFCEAPSVLEKYITTRNTEALKRALSGGKGTIVIAAHYGPALYAYMLHRIHSNVKVLYAREYIMHLSSTITLVPKFFQSKKLMFLNNSGIVLTALKEEKQFACHVKKGGLIATDLDFPGPKGNDSRVSLFGISMLPHVFLFRLALKHDIPVFFCLFNNVKRGGYRLDFIPIGKYSTPEEGFQRYLSNLQGKIEEHPFMWTAIPHFLKLSSCPRD